MYEDEDPLDDWVIINEHLAPGYTDERLLRTIKKSLRDLEQELAKPPTAKLRVSGLLPNIPDMSPIVLPPAERERAQQLVLKLAQRGGKDAPKAEEFLLNAIGLSESADAIPFWLSLLDLRPARDTFTRRRLSFALAALALLVVRHDDPAAAEALDVALRHGDEEVRAQAAYYLGGALHYAERPHRASVLSALKTCATDDPAFEARYQARLSLHLLGQPIPIDHQGGAYVFKAQLKADPTGATRTVALRAEQTLAELHLAIQDAFGWDAEHMYSFFLNGEAHDEAYEISSDEEDDLFDALLGESAKLFGVELEAPEEEDEGPAHFSTETALIGQLGLRAGHRLLYYFDFGDDHEFDVTLEAIQPQAEPGDYPRLVASEGEAPPQYEEE